jgi:hypothetical protein
MHFKKKTTEINVLATANLISKQEILQLPPEWLHLYGWAYINSPNRNKCCSMRWQDCSLETSRLK